MFLIVATVLPSLDLEEKNIVALEEGLELTTSSRATTVNDDVWKNRSPYKCSLLRTSRSIMNKFLDSDGKVLACK